MPSPAEPLAVEGFSATAKRLSFLKGSKEVRIDVGSARATGPNDYDKLFARTVIHAVGPDYAHNLSGIKGDRLLREAYASSLEIAKQRGIQYLCFPLISAGKYRGERSLRRIIEVSVDAVMSNAYVGLNELYLYAHTRDELASLKEFLLLRED